ncbi:uncharacterized protein LOC143056120 [Mytilus galloprovincialis]|uniref:uncharacterized protein LOC143056120 n=1 Tax=Mytilus galloprovincialis TaxID=29158 RepID=UPI003F7CC2FB
MAKLVNKLREIEGGGTIDVSNDEILMEIILDCSKTNILNNQPMDKLLDIERFSFEITPVGQILRVYHPEETDDFVLATKKGFAALLASRLHEEGEISGSPSNEGFTYQTQELGHEGPHNATYTVKQTNTGLQFIKVRHEPLVKNAGGKYQKVMHYHKDLEVIHSVLIEEDFISPTRPSGKFDALHGMRKIKAVNEFSTMGMY